MEFFLNVFSKRVRTCQLLSKRPGYYDSASKWETVSLNWPHASNSSFSKILSDSLNSLNSIQVLLHLGKPICRVRILPKNINQVLCELNISWLRYELWLSIFLIKYLSKLPRTPFIRTSCFNEQFNAVQISPIIQHNWIQRTIISFPFCKFDLFSI